MTDSELGNLILAKNAAYRCWEETGDDEYYKAWMELHRQYVAEQDRRARAKDATEPRTANTTMRRVEA